MANKLKLTDPFIRNYPKPEKRIEIYDKHTEGLAVRISKTGHKSFVYRYRFNNKVKRYTIGKFPHTRLAKARERAGELSYKISKGIDPLEEKKKNKHKPARKTFAELAAEYSQDYLPEKKESTRAEYQRIIDNELLPKLKKVDVPDVTSHRIRKILRAKKRSGSPTMANRIRSVLSSMFSYGMKEGWAKSNPVETTARYKSGENTRDRFYSEYEIKALWKAFEYEAEPFQSVFKMLLLTAQRKTETMKMKWDDISGNVWTIPAENAKNKQSHDVPLSDKAMQIIESMEPITGESDYVFESPRLENEPIGWIKQGVKRIRKISEVDDFRIHDLRRTAATYMAKSGTDPMIIGKILNHKGLAKENTITSIYNRHDYMAKKRQALSRWNHKLMQIIEGTETKITKIGA